MFVELSCYYMCFYFRKTDLLIGGLRTSTETQQNRIASFPYFYDSLTFCVPLAGRLPFWQNHFFVLDWWLWIIFIIIGYIFITILYYHLYTEEPKYRETFTKLSLITFAAFLGSSSTFQPRRATVRVYFALLLFFCLILNAVFNSFYLTQIKEPLFYKQVKKIDDIIYNKFQIIFTKESISFYEEQMVKVKYF